METFSDFQVYIEEDQDMREVFIIYGRPVRWPVSAIQFFSSFVSPTFYSARNARIASAVLATAIPSVCLSVRPSVHPSVCPSHAGIAPLNSKMCLVL